MAKKSVSLNLRSFMNKLMEKSFQSLFSVVAEESEHIAKWVRNISGLGRKIRRLLTAFVLFAAGLGVLGIGIALYLNELFPELKNGVSHVLVGLIIILIASAYAKSNG
jgi:hypothetical protein